MKKEFYSCNEEQICIPIPENYRDCLTLVKSDYFRKLGFYPSLLSIALDLINPFKNSILFWLRFSSIKRGGICRIMYNINSIIHQVQIPPETKIGYGFYIGHGICIVINSGTVIGNNVNISQFLNIGTNHNTPAVIGDEVYIGPHVCVVEDVNIGSKSTIGAGAVVTKNVPKCATVVNVPSKVINYDNPCRYICHKVDCNFVFKEY